MTSKNPRPQTKNLKPIRTTKEARKIGRAGGIASGKARRAKANFKETLKAMLEIQMGKDSEGHVVTLRDKISDALIKRAVGGDTKAFEVLRDTVGEKPTDKLQAEGFNEPRHFVFEIAKEKCKKQKK